MLRSLATAAAAALLGCSSAPREPAPRPAPEPDPGPGFRGPRSAEAIASYALTARYDAGAKTIAGTVELSWRNTGNQPVFEVPLHLYMNAFKNKDTVFWRESGGRLRRAKASTDDGWGWIDIADVVVDGSEAIPAEALRWPAPDETVVEIPLPRAVPPGGSLTVAMRFDVHLPEVFARTGYKGDFAMVGQWFPKIGVRVGSLFERWHCEPFHANSEFFADFGSYDVELTVPDTHAVAATGLLVDADKPEPGTVKLHYRATNVHDFAWMADPYMKTMSGTARTELGDVEVRVYYREPQRGFAKRHLVAGIAAIESLSRRLIPYPYSLVSIITPPPDAAMGAGGMEYPTLVTTAGDFALAVPGVWFPEFVTIHEVGHQWFQGMLASNEVDEAWLDEGVNEYIDCVVMNELYGSGLSMVDAYGLAADCFALRRASVAPITRHVIDPITTRSYEFATSGVYSSATYVKTSLALRTIENVVGADAFARALKLYARRFAFKHPTGVDFFRTLEGDIGRDLRPIIEPAFYGRGAVDLAVIDVHCREVSDGDERECRVVTSNRGEVPVPYAVDIELANGEHRRRELAPGPSHHAIELVVDSPVVAVTVDPDDKILLDEGGLAGEWRASADLAPVARVAGRARHWTQMLMGWVGL